MLGLPGMSSSVVSHPDVDMVRASDSSLGAKSSGFLAFETAVVAVRQTYSSKYLGLAFGWFAAVVTLILNSKWIQKQLYGDNFDKNEILWYILMVPAYTTTCIFCVRYWGTYFISIWVRELVSSDFVHSSIITLTQFVMRDPRIPQMLQERMMNEDIVDSMVDMVESVLSNTDVREGCGKLVTGVLRHPNMSVTGVEVSAELMRSQSIHNATGALLDHPDLTPAIQTQMVSVMHERAVHDATVRFTKDLTQDRDIRLRVKARTKSLVRDPTYYKAMGRGMYGAAFGPRTSPEALESVTEDT